MLVYYIVLFYLLKTLFITKEHQHLELKGSQTFLWAPLVMDVWEEEEEKE